MKKPADKLPDQIGKEVEPPVFRLQLYISGATPRSAQAVANLNAITEKRLSGRYELEVIDVGQQAALARDNQIVVLPTLIKHLPPPIRRIVGDLSDTEKVLLYLGLTVDQSSDTEREQ